MVGRKCAFPDEKEDNQSGYSDSLKSTSRRIVSNNSDPKISDSDKNTDNNEEDLQALKLSTKDAIASIKLQTPPLSPVPLITRR